MLIYKSSWGPLVDHGPPVETHWFSETFLTVKMVLLVIAPEGSSLHILPAKAHVYALVEQRAEGHVLSQSPVHCSVFDHVTTTL